MMHQLNVCLWVRTNGCLILLLFYSVTIGSIHDNPKVFMPRISVLLFLGILNRIETDADFHSCLCLITAF